MSGERSFVEPTVMGNAIGRIPWVVPREDLINFAANDRLYNPGQPEPSPFQTFETNSGLTMVEGTRSLADLVGPYTPLAEPSITAEAVATHMENVGLPLIQYVTVSVPMDAEGSGSN
jgi:hypothetical protein